MATCDKCDYVVCVCKPVVNKPEDLPEPLNAEVELCTMLEYSSWEEVPEEELWEDGELNSAEVQRKILYHAFQQGNWRLIRRKDGKD